MPRFGLAKKKGKNQDIGPLPWNSLERITGLMHPIIDPAQRLTYFKITAVSETQQFNLNVPGTSFKYKIEISNSFPLICLMPASSEIIYRLIARASFAKHKDEFILV